jgi:hypothetical protein
VTLADFREEETDALEHKKLPMIFVTEHNGTITVSKLSDCPIRIAVLFKNQLAVEAQKCRAGGRRPPQGPTPQIQHAQRGRS